MCEDHPYQCCWRQAGTRQTFGRKRRKCRIHVHRPKPYGNVSRLGKVIYDIVMNILPLCECLWEWWPLYLESNLRGEKSFLHIGDLATEEGSQRKAGRRWLLGTTSAPLCTPDPPKLVFVTFPSVPLGHDYPRQIQPWRVEMIVIEQSVFFNDLFAMFHPKVGCQYCHHRHGRWLVTRSDNGVDRGRKYFEK